MSGVVRITEAEMQEAAATITAGCDTFVQEYAAMVQAVQNTVGSGIVGQAGNALLASMETTLAKVNRVAELGREKSDGIRRTVASFADADTSFSSMIGAVEANTAL